MEDWDVDLFCAIRAAREAAATPLTRAMLDICNRDMELPFSASPKAMTRLLDIAILTGNQKATLNLSKKCHLRPLRRWAISWRIETCCEEAARTALWAGAAFQVLMVKYSYEEVPFPQALFLKSKLEDWQKIRHLLPQCHSLWRPRNLDNRLGEFFLDCPHEPDDCWQLSVGKIRSAEDAGLDLQFFSLSADGTFGGVRVTLLDLAIWYGQPDCAEACVDGGIELKGDGMTLAWHKHVLRAESLSLEIPFLALYVVPSEAKIAAAAAGRAWSKRFWNIYKLIVKMLVKMFKGRSFPMALAQEILTFSMPVSHIIDQLDLWAHVSDWMATICGRPARWVASSASVALGNGGSQISGRGGLDSSRQEPSFLPAIRHVFN